jgi:phosphoribulokinase
MRMTKMKPPDLGCRQVLYQLGRCRPTHTLFLSMKACTAVVTDDVNVARYADLKLALCQLSILNGHKSYTAIAIRVDTQRKPLGTETILRRRHDYVDHICPYNFQNRHQLSTRANC